MAGTQTTAQARSRSCIVRDLGRSPYPRVLRLQRDLVQAKHSRQLDPDVLLTVEHDPVFTLGRQGRRDSLLADEDFLAAQGITIHHIERGGDVTYHGPGQVVAYLLLDLRRAALRVTTFVSGLEQVMLRTARDFQVRAETNPERRGVWVGDRKLGSLGIAVRHGITFHGLALNAAPDLTPFSYINPCGLAGVRMTSLALESQMDIQTGQVRERLVRHMLDEFDLCPICADTTFFPSGPKG